jgi:hypothetical protein
VQTLPPIIKPRHAAGLFNMLEAANMAGISRQLLNYRVIHGIIPRPAHKWVYGTNCYYNVLEVKKIIEHVTKVKKSKLTNFMVTF